VALSHPMPRNGSDIISLSWYADSIFYIDQKIQEAHLLMDAKHYKQKLLDALYKPYTNCIACPLGLMEEKMLYLDKEIQTPSLCS